MEVTGGQGVQVGDGNVQINLFTGAQPPGPVVAGNVPQPAPAFQPRDDLMAALRAAGAGVSVVSAVTGLRGVGKTQLAAAYARDRRRAGWRLIAWVNAETPTAILDGLAVVADRLGLQREGATLEQLALEVRNRLEADGDRCLIVFDNVADPDAIAPYVPALGDPQVLITSTESAATALGRPVEVEVFTEAESLAFLADRTRLDDPAGARALAAELGCLPLALAQAAAVIAARRLAYPVYLDRLRAYPAERYLPAARGEPYPRGVAEAIGLSIDAATATGAGTGIGAGTVAGGALRGELLSVIALLSPDGVTRELLYQGATPDVFAAGPEDLDEALAALASASLVGFTHGGPADPDQPALESAAGPAVGDVTTVTAHRLVMRVTRERAARDGTLPGLVAKAVVLLHAYVRSIGDPWRSRPAARDVVRQVSALTASAASDQAAADREELLNLRSWAVWCASDLGDAPAQAVRLAEQLAVDSERVRGQSSRSSLGALSQLATAYQAAGQVREAVSMLERLLASCEELAGPTDLETIATRHNLAQAYLAAGRPADAIALLERVLADRAPADGEPSQELLSTQHSLASAYRAAGRLAEAQTLYEGALAGCERVLGRSHRDTLAVLGSLGTLYRATGRLTEAISLLEQTRAGYERLLGRSHPYTLVAGSNLAGAYQDAGRMADALPLFERVLAEAERVLGPSHPETLTARNNLAVAYRDVGRAADAVPLLEQTAADLDRVLGPEHPHSVTARASLALARAQAARPPDPDPDSDLGAGRTQAAADQSETAG